MFAKNMTTITIRKKNEKIEQIEKKLHASASSTDKLCLFHFFHYEYNNKQKHKE